MNSMLQNNPDKENILTNLQNFESMKSAIYRKKHATYPAVTNTRIPFVLNEDLCKTLDGNTFIFLNNLGEHDEIIFADITFIEKCNLNNLSLHMDGTFKSCPTTFYQLYVIQIIQGEHSFPIFYCFLSNKPLQTYQRIFRSIVEILRNKEIVFNPETIMIDYE